MRSVAIVSGYFDPLHIGHLDYLEMASLLADELVVIVNHDDSAALKKGRAFQPAEERLRIVESLACVTYAVMQSPKDAGSVVETIREIVAEDPFAKYWFANGGDRHNKEIPEAAICDALNVKIVDGLGDKIRSSSEIVRGATPDEDAWRWKPLDT